MASSGKAYLVRRGRALIACARGSGRTTVLAVNDPIGSTWLKTALAGGMAAFELRSEGMSPIVHNVMVVDVLRGRLCQVVSGSGVSPPDSTDPDTGEPITDLVVAPTGAVAFIAGPGRGPIDVGRYPDVAPWTGFEVIVSDARGPRQVAAGETVDRSSLRRRGSSVSWRMGGAASTVTLDGRPLRCRLRHLTA